MTARRSGGDRTATSQLLQLLQVCRTAAIRVPWGRRKDTVRPPYDFLGTQDRVKTICHLIAIARSLYGHCMVTLRCSYGVAVSEKMFNVKLKKNARLVMTLRRAKNREVVVWFAQNSKAPVWFGGLRAPYGRRKHATSYMWPWHNWHGRLEVRDVWKSVTCILNCSIPKWHKSEQSARSISILVSMRECQTRLKLNMCTHICGYPLNNRKGKLGGGVAIATRQDIANNTQVV